MKKAVLSLLVFILILSSCKSGLDNAPIISSSVSRIKSTESSTENVINSGGNKMICDKDGNEQRIKNDKVLEKSNTQEYKKLITKSYPQKDLIGSLSYMGSDNFNTMLYRLDEKYNIECIRTFKSSLSYCIYKLNEGGLLFVYFHGESLKFTNCIFVVKKALIKSDFNTIKEGDNLIKVESIDPGTKTINSIKHEYLKDKVTYHMIKEGFVKITYVSNDLDINTFKVKSVQFFDNGSNLNQNSYAFLQNDYPQ